MLEHSLPENLKSDEVFYPSRRVLDQTKRTLLLLAAECPADLFDKRDALGSFTEERLERIRLLQAKAPNDALSYTS